MYDKDNDIERILREDSIDKKKSGRGVFNRASRKGYIRGGLKTQSDFLTAKERKKLNGEVKVTNMYEKYKDLNNCILEEILAHENKEVKNILTFIKANHSTKVIGTQFKISNGKLYNIFKQYGVEYGVGARVKRTTTGNKSIDKDSLIEVKAFKSMDVMQKGQYLAPLVKEFRTSELAEYFGATKSMIHYYVKKAGGSGTRGAYKTKKIEKAIEEQIAIDKEILSEEVVKEVKFEKVVNAELENKLKEMELQIAYLQDKVNAADSKPKINGLKVEFNEICTKEELENRLISIASIAAEGRNYKISISLEEVSKDIEL